MNIITKTRKKLNNLPKKQKIILIVILIIVNIIAWGYLILALPYFLKTIRI